jgi:glycerophosphoryl diester phosphodiesterase
MQCIAHRGASGYAPENTRAAFDLAIAMGADAIETDVRLAADGCPVLFHDAIVDRASDGTGPVDDFTLEELRRLDLGAWFGPKFAGQRVLTLDEALDEYAGRIPVVWEIKDPRATGPLVERLVGRRLLDRAQVTSFWWFPLLEARALCPDPALALGFLTPTFEPDTVERIARRGFGQICPHVDRLTARRVAAAKERGLEVRAWGIDGRHQVERLIETGADGATVNWPDWILAADGRAPAPAINEAGGAG